MYALSNSSTELTHESATNISTQDIGVLCHNEYIHTYVCIHDANVVHMIRKPAPYICGRNLKIFNSER